MQDDTHAQRRGLDVRRQVVQEVRHRARLDQRGMRVADRLEVQHLGQIGDVAVQEVELAQARVAGDVGMAGVAIDSLLDMRQLFDGIDLGKGE